MSRKWSAFEILRGVALAGGVCLTPAAALAGEANVKAPFEIRFGPLQVGGGNFEAQISDQTYSIGVNARVSGVARLLNGGEGSASARGSIHSDRLAPVIYHLSNTAGANSNEIRLLMQGNNVVNEMVVPPSYPFPDRVPLTPAARQGVVDPLSSFVFPMAGADPMAPENCNRTLRLFDGRQRYDIKLRYDRVDAADLKGFDGQALMCKASYTPIAGYRRLPGDSDTPDSYHDMEAALVPVPGTHSLLVYRMQIMTPAGKLVVQAKSITMTPGPRQQAAVR